MNHQVFSGLYDSLVQPILNYGASIWGNKQWRLVRNVHTKACKFFMGVGGNTNNVAAQGDMGWSSALSRQHMQVFRLWIRLQKTPATRLSKKIHQWSKGRGSRTWEKQVRSLAEKYESWYILENCDNVNPKQVLRDMEKNVSAYCQVEWHHDIWNDRNNEINGNKLRTYRLHKDRLEPEQYLIQNIPRYKRRILSRLRCGTLPLAIETGRYTTPPTLLESRICNFCDKRCIESEIHFLIDCDMYSDLRYDVFNAMDDTFHNLPAQTKYIKLMLNCDIQGQLVNMCYNMFTRRKRFLIS